MKRYTITIKNNETFEENDFDTNGILGALINSEFGNDHSDTTQFTLGELSTKDVIKLLAGCTNMIYHLTDSTIEAENVIEVAQQIAKEAYKERLLKQQER